MLGAVVAVVGAGTSTLASWAIAVPAPRRGEVREGSLRFVFYGRMSTVEFQHRETSEQWQRLLAEDVVAGRGRIVAAYFDAGCSRRRGWRDRPGAAALLAEVESPSRRFDAIVVGEYERAFYGDQFQRLVPLFDRHRVQVWLPEIGGRVDTDDPAHRALLLLLGGQAKREVLRSRFRVLAAMRAQTIEQGRYLGGRPPFGYRLVDGGPHPNSAHAGWGRRLRRLEPDPVTASHVQWIFARRLAGTSVAWIARSLNDRSVACPSAVDRDRNRHRHTAGWTVRSVSAILHNPRYTGYQVWNRQRRDRDPGTPSSLNAEDPLVHRWNTAGDWAISKHRAHTALVSEDDFTAVQSVRVAPKPDTDEPRRYGLTGRIRCGVCHRSMEAHWSFRSPAYRCRHGHTSATPPGPRPRNTYARETVVVAYTAAVLGVPVDAGAVLVALQSQDLIIECGVDGLRVAKAVGISCLPRR